MPGLYTRDPEPEDVARAAKVGGCEAHVVRVRLVPCPVPPPRSPEVAAALERSRRRNPFREPR